MPYTKKEIEKRLKASLHEILRDGAQEDSIISLKYDSKKQECTVQMTVHIVPEDDYVGFAGY